MGDAIREAMEHWVERGEPAGGIALADWIEARLVEEIPAPSWGRTERAPDDAGKAVTLVVTEPGPPRRRRSGWVLALAAGAIVLAVGIPLLVLAGGDGDRVEPPVAPADLAGRPIDEIHDLALAPDGTLWAATARGVVRWESGGENPAVFLEEHGLPTADVGAIAAAPDGTVWAAGAGWLARYDGSWITFTDWPAESGSDVGAITVDGNGVLWAAVGEETLLRFDGVRWEARPAHLSQSGHPWAQSLAVGGDGSLWATFMIWQPGALRGGVAKYDNGVWTRFSGDDGLPDGMPLAVVAAPDGEMWAGFSATPDPDHPAGGGVARFDGTGWTTFTTTDGLAVDETVGIAVAADGTVWVAHAGGELSLAGGGLLSSFDGESWTIHDPGVGTPIWGLEADPSGGIWLATEQGVIQYDGTAITTITVPEDLVAETAPDFGLDQWSGPGLPRAVTSGGAITTLEYDQPAGRYLVRMVATAHGFVAVDSWNLRWSQDGITWSGLRLPFDVWGAAPVEDDLIAFGEGRAAYLTWSGGAWEVAGEIGLPGGVGWIQQAVAGPRGVVMTAEATTLHSTDGRSFTIASGPDPSAAEGDPRYDFEFLVGSCSPSGVGFSGRGEIGPVLATTDGFVAITPGWAADWNKDPICEPRLWFSPDGQEWDLLADEAPFGRNAYVSDVAEDAGRFIAIGGNGSGAALWTSVDGLSWTVLDWEGTAPRSLDAVASGEMGWIVLGTLDPGDPGFDPDHPYLWWYSADALTWEGPFPRPEGLATGWSAPYLAVGDDAAVGSSDRVVVFRLED